MSLVFVPAHRERTGVHVRTSYRWCWWLRNAAVSYEMHRQLEGTVEADDLYHTAGNKGKPNTEGKSPWGVERVGAARNANQGGGMMTKIGPLIACVSRQGSVVIHATKDFTVKTVQKAVDLAVQAGSRLYTDSASSYRAVKGYVHEFVNHTQKEYARGDVREPSGVSMLKPYLRVFRGLSKYNLPGYVGFFQFLRNFRHQNACEQAEMILCAALDPSIRAEPERRAC